jgi:murein DD-endopeptidase MepM/ murein hydrolase activator NlpD
MKKLLITLRASIKVLVLITLATFLILAAVALIYKPIYKVTLNGEFIGYCENKSELQAKINNYLKTGDTDSENIAFAQLDVLPKYEICLLKKDIVTTDEEIYNTVISSGTNYYRYYAILLNSEEKMYVSTLEEAEQAVSSLKEKNSNNINKIAILEKYETELKEFSTTDEVVSALYEKKVVVATSNVSYSSSINTSSTVVSLNGVTLARPVSGTVSSRFGIRNGTAHKGLDIAAAKGTPIYAAASGTIITSAYGWNGGYGNYVVINHGNGINTAYGHCSSLVAQVGQTVNQGDLIAYVGNTGDSYGNHLHFEVRVNGVAQNPQNYLY